MGEQGLFDLEPIRRDEVTDLTATRASFDVRGFTIDLLSPAGKRPVREALERDGEGPFEVKNSQRRRRPAGLRPLSRVLEAYTLTSGR
jgi:hypothetical protein